MTEIGTVQLNTLYLASRGGWKPGNKISLEDHP